MGTILIVHGQHCLLDSVLSKWSKKEGMEIGLLVKQARIHGCTYPLSVLDCGHDTLSSCLHFLTIMKCEVEQQAKINYFHFFFFCDFFGLILLVVVVGFLFCFGLVWFWSGCFILATTTKTNKPEYTFPLYLKINQN